jgi:hypothetical protein
MVKKQRLLKSCPASETWNPLNGILNFAMLPDFAMVLPITYWPVVPVMVKAESEKSNFTSSLCEMGLWL